MNRGFSLYLDILRFGAAFIVLMSHFGYSRFSDGRWLWIRELNLGSDAVVFFFVLSGLVIAFVAQTKDSDGQTFMWNRVTRIVSVALPVLVLGFVVDQLGARAYPQTYATANYNPLSFGEQLVRGLSFTNEWGALTTRIGTNGPYWSLSYEVAYYLLFACAFYLSGARRAAALIAGCLIVGVNVLLLAPCWLAGVWLWKRIDSGITVSRQTALVLCLAPVALYAMMLWVDLPLLLKYVTRFWLGIEGGLRFSDEFLWNWILAAMVCAHLAGSYALLTERSFARHAPAIRWLAGGSFSLYLVHYPVMQFLEPMRPDLGPVANDVILVGLVTLICYGFAHIFERTLPAQRAALRGLAGPKQKAPSV